MSTLRPTVLATLMLALTLAPGCTPVPGGVSQVPEGTADHAAHSSTLVTEKISIQAIDSHNIQIKGATGAAPHSKGILGFKGELIEMPGEASQSFAVEVGSDGAFTSATLHVHDGGKLTLFAFSEQDGNKTFSKPLTVQRRDLDPTKLKLSEVDDHSVSFQASAGAVGYGSLVLAYVGAHTTKPDTTPWKTLAVQPDGSLPETSMHLHHGDAITLFAEADEKGSKVYSKPVTLTVE